MACLEGVKVLDLSRLLPGPYCSMILADFGAEVIKIEEPVLGDYARDFWPKEDGKSVFFSILNKNKKSISLNLQKEEGKKIFYRLAKDADIILESFRPGVTERLGIDYEKINSINPRIIYCSLTGYGQKGPYKDRAGHDLNYISISGMLSLLGQGKDIPSVPGVQISDVAGALTGVNGILLALLERNNSGQGQYVDISLTDCALALLPIPASIYLGSGQIPPLEGSFLTGAEPNYNIYETKDGKYLAVGALEKKFWSNFCRGIKRADLIEELTEQEKYPLLKKQVSNEIIKKTQEEWLEIFENLDACVTPVNNIAEAFKDPQLRDLKMCESIKLSRTPAKFYGEVPDLGEHTENYLLDCGYSLEEIEKLRVNNVIK